MTEPFWKKCSICKKQIGFEKMYYQCNVSTCNRPRTGLQFCSVSCWSGHVPVMRHRDSWAVEATSPTQSNWEKELITMTSDDSSNAKTPVPSAPTSSQPNNDEILVVVSKLKNYIKDKSDMNTSADVMDCLSQKIRRLCDEAVIKARQSGRKTVMARDF